MVQWISWSTGKDPDVGKDRRQKEKRVTEDEMVWWYQWIQWTWTWTNSGRWRRIGRPGVLQSMVVSESDMTWQLNAHTVDKNPPDNAGNMGSIPGPERSHMPQNNLAHVPQLLCLCSTACEPHCWAHVLQLLKPTRPKVCALQQESSPCSLN